MPNKLDINQLRLLFSTEELCAGVVLAATAKVPVKYGFCALRIGLGELSGEAGSDFDPRRTIRRDDCCDIGS